MTYVLYHANCVDGFVAAYLFWKQISIAKFIPVQYGQPLPELTDAEYVYIVDFSYDRETLIKLNEQVKLVVLDHHETAKDNLEGLDFCIFDLEKSGAMLAWEYIHPDTPPPALILYVQDRDLWTKAMPDCDAIHSALSTYYLGNFEKFHELMDHDFKIAELIATGRVIEDCKRNIIERVIKHHHLVPNEQDQPIPTLNSPVYQSELGHELCNLYPDSPYADIWYINNEGLKVHSLRSAKGLAGPAAKQYGGGGHPNAAGYVESRPDH